MLSSTKFTLEPQNSVQMIERIIASDPRVLNKFMILCWVTIQSFPGTRSPRVGGGGGLDILEEIPKPLQTASDVQNQTFKHTEP